MSVIIVHHKHIQIKDWSEMTRLQNEKGNFVLGQLTPWGRLGEGHDNQDDKFFKKQKFSYIP